MALKSTLLVAACAALIGGARCVHADAAMTMQPFAAWRDPLYVSPAIVPPFNPYYPYYYGYYGYGACYPFASCAAFQDYRLMLRRLERFDELSRPPPARHPHFPLPGGPPTPEAELQPQYRDSGKVLPQHQHAGEWLQGNAPQTR